MFVFAPAEPEAQAVDTACGGWWVWVRLCIVVNFV